MSFYVTINKLFVFYFSDDMMMTTSKHGNADHGANTSLWLSFRASYFWQQSLWPSFGSYFIVTATASKNQTSSSIFTLLWWLQATSHLPAFVIKALVNSISFTQFYSKLLFQPFFSIVFADAARTWLWNSVTCSFMHLQFRALSLDFLLFGMQRIKRKHHIFIHFIHGLA